MTIRTFPVLAGAYRTRLPPAASLLTHACEVDTDGFPTRVLCKRVKLDSICADLVVATGEAPTCPVCAKRWLKTAYLVTHPKLTGSFEVLDGTGMKGLVRIRSLAGGIIWHVFADALKTHDGTPFKPEARHLELLPASRRAVRDAIVVRRIF